MESKTLLLMAEALNSQFKKFRKKSKSDTEAVLKMYKYLNSIEKEKLKIGKDWMLCIKKRNIIPQKLKKY